jgi:hypothetical protein
MHFYNVCLIYSGMMYIYQCVSPFINTCHHCNKKQLIFVMGYISCDAEVFLFIHSSFSPGLT